MKKLTTISLFIFWAAITAILSASLLSYQNNKDGQKGGLNISGTYNELGTAVTNTASDAQAPNINSVAGSTNKFTLNMEEIAKHNYSSNCWLLISGKIYNVTSYIAAHPGGAGTIIPTCGTDSTKAYATKNGNSPHSSNAHALLAAYYIGDLNQQTSVQQVQQSVQTTNTITPPTTRGNDEEEGEND